MSFSALFIRRPVATILIAIAMVVAGGFAYFQLPVAALPNVEFPVISVSASLPGAAPDAMATSVATPLIKQFTQIPAVTSISATSTQGSTSIVLQFDLARNIDQAGADVQAAIDRTLRQLPANMTSPPSYRKTNPADSPIMLVALQSDTQSLTQLDSYAEDVISPALSTLDGVGQVQVFGAKQYAVRVEVQPAAMTARNIGIDQLDAALSSANSITPMGTIANAQQQITLESNATPSNAAEFRQIIIADPAGKPVRLGDVANVIDSVANTQNASSYDGKPAIVLSVFRQPGANTVSVADEVRAALPRFTADLGPSAKISVLNDRSSSVKAAVNDVELTLMVIIGLVVLVIYAFLRRVRATLIPALAVPTSLIVTFGAMYLLGLSIDNISLLGLTLAVGLVVDDAIVMLENIVRHIDEGMAPMEAALKGSSEIGFTIISITVSLVAVFLPVLLMGGVVGKLLNEFAVVVSIAIVASAIISLTLTPMLSARLPAKTETGTRRPPLTERLFAGLLGGYRTALDFCLRLRPAILVVFLLTIVATGWLFTTINKSFLPVEDIGQLNISTQARQDISFPAMQALQDQVVKVVSAQPFVAHVASTVGGGFGASGSNSGSLNVQLTPRRPDLDTVLATLRRELGKVPGISSFVVPVQDFQLGGRSSASQYQFVVEANNPDDLYTWAQRLTAAMQQDGGHFADVTNDIRNNALQAQLVVDQQRASLLGITQQQLRSTLYSDFGTNQATTIYGSSDSYPVIVELDPSMNWGTNELDQIQIRSTTTGKLVPLSAFARVERKAGTLAVSQQGQLPAVTISFNLPAGVALGTAVNQLDAIKASVGAPTSIITSLAGTAQVFQQAQGNQLLLIGAAIVVIYIVLGILYESFIHPLTILTGLPSAVMGALLSLQLLHIDLSIIAIIGLLMLIGIVKKNAIMMVDFALQRQRAGAAPFDAIREACLIRFRPIMMTTMAAIMGTLPIALGLGASAELRQPLGVAVVGGLIVSQVLTLFVTPVIFLYMEQLRGFVAGLPARLRRHAPPARPLAPRA
ncbi:MULTISPECIES: efflux RND transporter permease subunit [unclassified Devosia]|uniref:efflux RND transporter permease subunit n=1 Tax=unclassified Devosia TaxID=196773 RepID=UPI00086D7564|nr:MULTISPECIES: efflux RND transporter permease subunit [unclassified Devosia]MBN9364422.1 efflux RND transporter permease subunit [Devosia sp.]ODS87007.1 MAG: acriflavine resistance protein B [Devosia sp. SCN 66-27]OJX20794.1 MAG: acriflavine resistance protein B [Devosia sp. 66-14]